MIKRVSWSAIVAVLLSNFAIAFAVAGEQALALAFGLGAVTWAILSLKEKR
jgi:hypothetical protein